MNRLFKHILPAAALTLLFGMTSCTKDLDVTPIDPNLDTEVNADGLFNKCYANLGLQGNGGANGDCDITVSMAVRQDLSARCGTPTN